MTTEERTKVIERVKKLMALADAKSDATEAEAAVAASMARKLMDEYDMSLSDIEVLAEEIIQHTVNTWVNRPKPWMGRLALVVADFNNCKVFKSGGHMVFVGIKSDVQVAEYVYLYLFRTILRMYDEHLNKLRRSGEWAMIQRGRPRVYMAKL